MMMMMIFNDHLGDDNFFYDDDYFEHDDKNDGWTDGQWLCKT